MRRLIGDESRVSYALASSTGVVVWQPVTGQLNGLFLPSLQRFTIPLPSVIVKPPGSAEPIPVLSLALTSRALYVRDGGVGTLWRTASPTALPLNTSRPGLTRSGRTLACSRGSWRNAVCFSWVWRVNGVAIHAANKPRLAMGKAQKRRRVSCSVTASNATGTTTASSAQLDVR